MTASPWCCGHGADLMHPLTVGPPSHVLATCDERAAPQDLARSVCLVVVPQGAVLVLVTHGPVFFRREAQVFLYSLFDFLTSEIRWDCHVASRRCDGVIRLLAAVSQPQRLSVGSAPGVLAADGPLPLGFQAAGDYRRGDREPGNGGRPRSGGRWEGKYPSPAD
jgi:hypothetical protein